MRVSMSCKLEADDRTAGFGLVIIPSRTDIGPNIARYRACLLVLCNICLNASQKVCNEEGRGCIFLRWLLKRSLLQQQR